MSKRKIKWGHLVGEPRSDWYSPDGHKITKQGGVYLLELQVESRDYQDLFATANEAKEYAEQFV